MGVSSGSRLGSQKARNGIASRFLPLPDGTARSISTSRLLLKDVLVHEGMRFVLMDNIHSSI